MGRFRLLLCNPAAFARKRLTRNATRPPIAHNLHSVKCALHHDLDRARLRCASERTLTRARVAGRGVGAVSQAHPRPRLRSQYGTFLGFSRSGDPGLMHRERGWVSDGTVKKISERTVGLDQGYPQCRPGRARSVDKSVDGGAKIAPRGAKRHGFHVERDTRSRCSLYVADEKMRRRTMEGVWVR